MRWAEREGGACLLPALAALALACSEAPSGTGPVAASEADAAVYARVAGEAVTRAELEGLSEMLASRRPGRPAPELDEVLEAWIEARVLRTVVAERGLDQTDTYRTRMAAVRARAWRSEQELARNALVAQLEGDVVVTEEELRGLYEENAQRYLTTSLHLRNITVPDRPTILAIRKQLAEGQSFEELARQANLDPALRQKGGDMGWVEQRKLPTHVIGPAHLLLEPGDVSEPFVDREGRWSLLQLLGRKKTARRSFESVREPLERELRMVRSREALAELLAARRAVVPVERPQPEERLQPAERPQPD